MKNLGLNAEIGLVKRMHHNDSDKQFESIIKSIISEGSDEEVKPVRFNKIQRPLTMLRSNEACDEDLPDEEESGSEAAKSFHRASIEHSQSPTVKRVSINERLK